MCLKIYFFYSYIKLLFLKFFFIYILLKIDSLICNLDFPLLELFYKFLIKIYNNFLLFI
jgi:hypothetical protein